MAKERGYTKKIMDRIRLARLQKTMPPGLHHINIFHEDSCSLIRGTGECDCTPDISGPIPNSEYDGPNTPKRNN
jgi:hypothetical protein